MNSEAEKQATERQVARNSIQIQKAREAFAALSDACHKSPNPTESLRKQQLRALKKAISKHQSNLLKAIEADFGCRSNDESLLADVIPVMMQIDYTLKHLRQWMKPERRSVSLLFQPAKAGIIYQPVGVVGIMAPWNYPVLLSLSPVISAIAAGNRVMLKPSEHSPYANRIIIQILKEALTRDELRIIEGDTSVAEAFARLPFAHLLFTGSTQTGRYVMAAAAQNLTPVTLELGGKSPVIMAPDASPELVASRVIYGKSLNAGQTCVAPDYLMCPKDKLAAFIKAAKVEFNVRYPDFESGDFTSIINDSQYQRLTELLKDAKSQGAELIPLVEYSNASTRLMPLTLVTGVNSLMDVMQQEIFGPILPVITYDNIQQAIDYVQTQPRPLALYLFTHNKKLEQHVLHNTISGGICINDTVTQVAQNDLPFGGVGHSGMGNYHAREGFLTFSKIKSVFKRRKINPIKLIYPPYGRLVHRLLLRWFV